jgi:hypothetical protein
MVWQPATAMPNTAARKQVLIDIVVSLVMTVMRDAT